MSRTASTLLLLAIVFATPAQTPPLRATHIGHGDIETFLNGLPKDAVSDKPIRIVDVGGYHVGVYGVLRPGTVAQEANLHQTNVSEIYYILQGNATLVTGGALPDPKPLRPGSTTLQSSRIEGGESRNVSAGDVVIIPGRIPHWFSHQDGDLRYLIFRPDPERTLPLK